MRAAAGVALLLSALLAAGIAGLWAYGKAFGTEFDVCPGARCYSGWYAVATFALLAVLLALAGRRLLRDARAA